VSPALYTLCGNRSSRRDGAIVSIETTQAPFFSHGQEADSDDQSIGNVAFHYERIRTQEAHSKVVFLVWRQRPKEKAGLSHSSVKRYSFSSCDIHIMAVFDDSQLTDKASTPHGI
jgi:hypothetical protein